MKVALVLATPVMAAAAYLIAMRVAAVAPSLGLVDHPNARSSHTRATARGGGIGFVVAWVVAILVGWLGQWLDDFWLAAVMATAGVAAIGLWDDMKGLSPWLRLACHIGAATVLVAALPALPVAFPLMSDAVATVGVVLAIAWMVNLFNFMDGIDGLAASEAAFCAAAMAGLAAWQAGWDAAFPAWMLVAAVAGFLPANWPPARVFMGDVGSGFLGLALSALGLHLVSTEALPVQAVLILPAVFVVDATVTVLRRAARGARIHDAHRTHAYQRLARRLCSHRAVTGIATALNVGWVLPWAVSSCISAERGWIAVAICYAPLLLIAFWLGAGRDDGK